MVKGRQCSGRRQKSGNGNVLMEGKLVSIGCELQSERGIGEVRNHSGGVEMGDE